MRKSIAVILLLAFSLVVVGAHGTPDRVTKDKDAGAVLKKAECNASMELGVFVNDASVLEVPAVFHKHLESVYSLSIGVKPEIQAKTPGPTKRVKHHLFRSRDIHGA
ncbi:MAG TPA: hypothetical protein VK666_21725 [Chryseolinea sp.]|nr:hypothetical protein [Chryseolinea sp.]